MANQPNYSYVSPTVRASGSVLSDLQAGGFNGDIEKLITANNAAIANATTAPTVDASAGTTGTLAAGTYYCKYTWTNGYGETLASTESAQFTQASGKIPVVTVPATPAGATGWNLYLTAANGASGTETLYASGLTGTTGSLTNAAPTATQPAPPTTNTTALSSFPTLLSHLRANSPATFWEFDLHTRRLVSNFISGYPVSVSDLLARLTRAATVYKTLLAATEEIATLVAANPGTIATTAGNVASTTRRTWP